MFFVCLLWARLRPSFICTNSVKKYWKKAYIFCAIGAEGTSLTFWFYIKGFMCSHERWNFLLRVALSQMENILLYVTVSCWILVRFMLCWLPFQRERHSVISVLIYLQGLKMICVYRVSAHIVCFNFLSYERGNKPF